MSQIENTEKLSQPPGISPFAICWLGLAAVAMIAWTGMLTWGVWRLVDWLLS